MNASLENFRLRPDLSWTSRVAGNRTRWLVRDPLTYDHFLVSASERTIALLIDHCQTVEELLSEFHVKHPFQRLTPQACVRFVQKLCGLGIVLDDRRDQSLGRSRRRGKQKQTTRLLRLLSPLSFRLPGIDASWVLTRADRLSPILFHSMTIMATATIFTILFGFVISHLDAVAGKFLDNVSYLNAGDAALMVVVFVVIKLLHEIGHALACRHYGAQCHEIGILFLVFMPCLYCDVTDAWRLKSRWQRMFIAAAGMYVEIIISIFAMIVWLNTVPSVLNTLAFNSLIVCSVSTVFVNANPLIRYDGYYILTDLTDIPNLGAQAQETLQQRVVAWLAHRDVGRTRQDGSEAFLLSYALAALCYRCLIITVICWMLIHVGRQYHFEPLSWTIIVAVLVGLLWSVSRTLRNIVQRVKLGGLRWLPTALSLGLLLFSAITIWVPYSADVPVVGIVVASNTTPIYASQSGHLTWTVSPGTRVERDDVVAVITNYEVQLRGSEIQGEINTALLREKHFVDRSTIDSTVGSELQTVRSRLQQLRVQLKTVESELDELEIRAAHDGWVISVQWKLEETSDERRLTTWNGDLVSIENRGCFVERGEILCRLVTDDEWQAVFYVPDESIDLIRKQADTRIQLAAYPGRVFRSVVGQIGREAVDDIPLALRDRIAHTNQDGTIRPLEPHYRVAAKFVAKSCQPAYAGVVHGQVAMRPMSLMQRVVRYTKRVWQMEIR